MKKAENKRKYFGSCDPCFGNDSSIELTFFKHENGSIELVSERLISPKEDQFVKDREDREKAFLEKITEMNNYFNLKPILKKCATKVSSSQEHCPQEGVHLIGESEYLCEDCFKNYKQKD